MPRDKLKSKEAKYGLCKRGSKKNNSNLTKNCRIVMIKLNLVACYGIIYLEAPYYRLFELRKCIFISWGKEYKHDL